MGLNWKELEPGISLGGILEPGIRLGGIVEPRIILGVY